MPKVTRVEDLDTGVIFPTLAECATALDVRPHELSAVARLCGPEATVRRHRLKFIAGDKCRSKKVQCVETGTIFPSAKEAAKFADRSPYTLHHAAQKGIKSGGFRWRYLDDH